MGYYNNYPDAWNITKENNSAHNRAGNITLQTLDNFISCPGFFKRISDCKVTTLGVRSNHAAIKVKFRLTDIKFNFDCGMVAAHS